MYWITFQGEARMLDPQALIALLGEPTEDGRLVTPTPDSRYIWSWDCGCIARGIENRAAVAFCIDHANADRATE